MSEGTIIRYFYRYKRMRAVQQNRPETAISNLPVRSQTKER